MDTAIDLTHCVTRSEVGGSGTRTIASLLHCFVKRQTLPAELHGYIACRSLSATSSPG